MVLRDCTYRSPPACQFIDVLDAFEWGYWLPWEQAVAVGAGGALRRRAKDKRARSA